MLNSCPVDLKLLDPKPVDSKYYTKRHKVIRDLVHEYIHLTAFESTLIDTVYFQRLRDISQATASYVFPNANHTRFEHSLGTFELTRKAIEAVKSNGLFLFDHNSPEIHKDIEFSTLVAALYHDIGHSPFSHLGEKQFDESAIDKRLKEKLGLVINDNNIVNKLLNCGARHEKLSCLIIIEKFWHELIDAQYHEGSEIVSLNLEHICRCILGIVYADYHDLPKQIRKRNCTEDLIMCNFCIRLVNCSTFDMDSLDYIMRDTMYFALNSSKIDIQRLFSSMFISKDGFPIFKRQAISVLRDIIDEKNNDYLNAINHHTTLYSNFLYEFVFRRFKNDHLFDMDKFFSAHAVINLQVSDSDIWAMFKEKHREFTDKIISDNFTSEDEKDRVIRINDLLVSIFSRRFLKPFWKDIVEFEDFRKRHFVHNSETFERICDYVCSHSHAEHFRSEVIPVVVCILNMIHEKACSEMPEKLKGHELFLVDVQQKWLDKANINGLSIYMRENEVRNPTRFGGKSPYEYKEMPLKDVLPLSHYSELYSNRGFYIYVKPIQRTTTDVERKYYTCIEEIIVKVLSYFVDEIPGGIENFLLVAGAEKEALLDSIKKELWKRVKRDLQIDSSDD